MNTLMNVISFALLQINAKIAGLLTSEYTLIVLQDEEVPLASGAKTGNTPRVIAVCVVCLILFFFALYEARRNSLIKRLSDLRRKNGITGKSYPIVLSKLEEEIRELENEIASSIDVEA